MSTSFPIESSLKKRKRPLPGSQGDGEGSGGPDLEDLEIRPPSAPPLRVRQDGQRFDTMRNILLVNNLTAADGVQQNRESAATAIAKSVFYQVKESPNSYPPLKSVAEYLWYILDNCEVRPLTCILNLQC